MASKIVQLIGFLAILAIASSDEVKQVVGYKENVTLECNLPNPQFYLKTLEVAVAPTQGETPAAAPTDNNEKLIETKEGKYKVEGGELVIEDLRGEEIKGEIICKSKDSDSDKKTYTFSKIKPFLFKPEKQSITETSGGNAVFKCTKLYGSGQTTWEWLKDDNVTLVSGTGNVVIESDDNTTTLTLKEVKEEDKGEYMCILKNEHGSYSEKVNLRVKSALAALWPFLGIVAEVVILCVIILGYETRCGKKKQTEEEDNDAAQNLMGREGAQASDLKKRTAKA